MTVVFQRMDVWTFLFYFCVADTFSYSMLQNGKLLINKQMWKSTAKYTIFSDFTTKLVFKTSVPNHKNKSSNLITRG